MCACFSLLICPIPICTYFRLVLSPVLVRTAPTFAHREIQGVLQFSVKTAEQSLSEVQPHVVVKLVEGRQKRLKLIQMAANGRMKDIDQRSAELCAGNSAHLLTFQKKAEENNKIAEQMTKEVTEKLLQIFQSS